MSNISLRNTRGRLATGALRRWLSARPTSLRYETCDVFTNEKFGGNPLAVCFQADGLSTESMQKIAAEFNYSETTFVLPPTDPANTAAVRIFTPVCELPFAGHPNVGTACLLARQGSAFGKAITSDEVVFEEQAGLVKIALLRNASRSRCVGAILTAPQAFSQLATVPRAEAAAALGLSTDDVVGDGVVGSTGGPYVLAELASRSALEKLYPVPPSFEASSAMAAAFAPHPVKKILAYLPTPDEGAAGGIDLRCRMVNSRGIEDPATGAANAALAGLLASRMQGSGTLSLTIAQGVEMGRPSRLLAEADYADGGAHTVRIGGICVPMMKGELEL